MALFIPSIEKIQQFRVQPTEGEWHLLRFLESTLDDTYEVYFNPFLNGDRPDVIIMQKGGGVMIIEVKDWNLDSYTVDEKRHWHLKHPKNDAEARTRLSSPVQQVFKYKENLFELHIPGLLELKIKDIRNFNFVTCAVYFHNATEQQVRSILVDPFPKDHKYLNFLKYNIDLLGKDSLNEANFKKILFNHYLVKERPSMIFTDALYQSFKQQLIPTRHLMSEGVDLRYSRDQERLIYDTSKSWRVKGVVGSGKTTVLAAKAIESCKRVLAEGGTPRILILTYNVTLKNFIRDKLSKVRADFEWSYFTILNYHNFIGTMMNELGIPFEMPQQGQDETHIQYMRRVSPYLNANYYNNRSLFVDYASSIKKYDAIFIDEIQDYLRPWMEIVKDNFLASDGEYYLFGDVKQNIYSRQVSQKDVSTNIIGRPKELKTCFRADMKVRDLAVGFQNVYFQDKYEIDTLVAESDQGLLFGRDELQHGSIKYIPLLSLQDPIISLNTIIMGNIANKDNQNVHPNDITILGTNINLLKKIDSYYRYIGNGDTATMFETYDLMYIQHLNYFGNDAKNAPGWINELFRLVGQINNPKRARGNQIIGGFLARYELYREYPGNFGSILEVLCRRYRFEFKDFLAILARHEDEYIKFKDEVFKTDNDYSKIRDNKKLNFYMNTGTIKISTIHSFKGWESEVVFLLLEKKNESERSFDEILYTGLTRTRSNLIVINLGNQEYHEQMKQLIETYK